MKRSRRSANMHLNLFVILLCAVVAAYAAAGGNSSGAAHQKRVLALVDDLNIEKSHSLLLRFLRGNGFSVDIKQASEAGLRLHRYGELLYDHLLLFAPKATRFGGDITVENIVKFIDMGGNILASAGVGTTSELLRNLALECGFELDESGTAVIDHFNYDITDADGPHTLITVDASNLIQTKEVVGAGHSAPFLYRGIALRVDEANPLAFSVLHASSQAYSYKPGKQITTYPFAVGRGTVLVGSMQARNNARVTIVGSFEFFSDSFFQSPVNSASNQGEKSAKSGNEPLAQALALWTFKQAGVLRIVDVQHSLVSNASSSGIVPQPVEYTVMEDCKYRVQIEQFKPSTTGAGEWVPYQGNDVQLEFVRIDPFIRTVLKPEGKLYLSTQFKVPDVYGVFTFRINHKRQGLTYLESRVQIPVRPLLHTQYERFIYSAYPYYASAFSMMLGVLLLSVVFVGLRENDGGSSSSAARRGDMNAAAGSSGAASSSTSTSYSTTTTTGKRQESGSH